MVNQSWTLSNKVIWVENIFRWVLTFPPFQRDDGDLASGFRLMLGEEGVLRHDSVPQLLPLLPRRDHGSGLEGLCPSLNGDLGVRDQVMVPVRVDRRANVGSDHQQAVAIRDIHHRRYMGLAALSAPGRKQEECPALKWATRCAPSRAKLLDELAVVLFLLGHLRLFPFIRLL